MLFYQTLLYQSILLKINLDAIVPTMTPVLTPDMWEALSLGTITVNCEATNSDRLAIIPVGNNHFFIAIWKFSFFLLNTERYLFLANTVITNYQT